MKKLLFVLTITLLAAGCNNSDSDKISQLQQQVQQLQQQNSQQSQTMINFYIGNQKKLENCLNNSSAIYTKEFNAGIQPINSQQILLQEYQANNTNCYKLYPTQPAQAGQ